MKKIALVITDFDRLTSTGGIKGGGSHVLKNIMFNWIKNKKVILDVYCTKTSTFMYEGINRIVQIPICQYGNIKGFVSKLKEYVNVGQYDNVLFGEVIAPFGSVMLQAHSYSYRYDLYGGLKTKLFRYFKRKKIDSQQESFSDENGLYIAMSDKVKDDYSRTFNIPEDKIKVVYPGVDVPSDFNKVNNETITFGIIGSSNVNKGAYRFFEALGKLKKHNKNIKAVMICNNYEKLYLLQFLVWFYGLRDFVEILDFQASMDDFYKRIDCIVMPSRHEAFGLVSLEGSAYKAVPIVSNNTGFAEIATDGENAFIFDINKNGVQNLYLKMKDISDLYYNNPVKFNEIKENAYHLSKKYSWQSFTDKILEYL